MTSESDPWTVYEHVAPAFHPRTSRRGVRDPKTSKLSLHVKEYRCLSPGEASGKDAITIIFAHGGGSVKEEYEPFFSDLLKSPSVPPIRAIWAADIVGHGQSFRLNREELGDDVDWFDSARDIISLVNYFRDSMAPPLVGMGQSWGAVAILANAAWHPRFFQAVVAIEPTIPQPTRKNTREKSSTRLVYSILKLPDSWPSKETARTYFERSPYYSTFDRRVLDKVIEYEIQAAREGSEEVISNVPKLQQFMLTSRFDPPLRGVPPTEDYATRPPETIRAGAFYRTEGVKLKQMMLGIHCKTFYLWSRDDSFISDEDYRNGVVSVTGTGLGGAGGEATGQVTQDFVEVGRHALPFQNPTGTAAHVARYLAGIYAWWRDEEEKRKLDAPVDPVTVPEEVFQRANKASGEVSVVERPTKL